MFLFDSLIMAIAREVATSLAHPVGILYVEAILGGLFVILFSYLEIQDLLSLTQLAKIRRPPARYL